MGNVVKRVSIFAVWVVIAGAIVVAAVTGGHLLVDASSSGVAK